MHFRNHSSLVLGFCLALTTGGMAYAQVEITVVSPSELEDREGNSRTPAGGDAKFQTLYSASDFESIPGTHRLITGYALRPDETTLFNDPITGRFKVSVGTTAENSLTDNYAQNLGPNAKVVFEGEITWQTDNDPPEGPREFDYPITFTDPFVYSGGNLVVQFEAPEDWSNTTDWFLDSEDFGGGAPITGIGGAPGAETASILVPWVYSAQFTFAVPEPSYSTLFLLGAGCLTVLRRPGCAR